MMNSTALIEGDYRYWLGRQWALKGGTLLWVMMNPSTADGDTDDATLKRIIKFSQAFGYGRLIVCNLFAWRATDPRDLWAARERGEDIIGPRNGNMIRTCLQVSDDAIAAWGAGVRLEATRMSEVRFQMRLSKAATHCMGYTQKDHIPRHPLYLRKDALMEKWQA